MANGYRIKYRIVGGADPTPTDVGASTEYEQTLLEPGTEYQAQVQYYEDAVDSNWSDWVTVSTKANQTLAGISTKSDAASNPGTVVAESSVSQAIEGVITEAVAVSDAGTVVSNQIIELAGVDTKT